MDKLSGVSSAYELSLHAAAEKAQKEDQHKVEMLDNKYKVDMLDTLKNIEKNTAVLK